MFAKERTCQSIGYRALVLSQLFGAINDNLLKLFVTLLVVERIYAASAPSSIVHLILINVCFVSPFLIFSPLAGALSDTFAKSQVIQRTKFLELAIMLFSLPALHYESVSALLVILFLLGIQATLFSPAKYGLLPEMLEEEELSQGNGYLEFSTFSGILLGTALAGMVLRGWTFASDVPGALLVLFSVLGICAAYLIPKSARLSTAPPDIRETVSLHPRVIVNSLREIRQNRPLFLAVLALAYCWSLGSLYQLNIVLYSKLLSGIGELGIALQLACLGVGIGLGSMIAGKVSQGKVELGLVPIGALGLAIFSIVLAFIASYPALVGLVMIGLGFSAGFFIVPLNAFIQEKSPAAHRGNYIAASNFCSYAGMLLFSFLLLLLVDGFGLSPSQVFFVCGCTAIFAALYICTVLPEMLLRCVNWMLIHLVYRIRVFGLENVPVSGGALLVCNHVSMLDACLLLASARRPIRFLMYRPYYEAKLIKPFAKLLGAVPIESSRSKEGKEEINKSLAAATEAIAAGELVAIFAEGALTRTGQMQKFRRGFEIIMEGVEAPIIPTHLDEVWGSIFSFEKGKFIWKFPRKVPYPVTITFGEQLPADSTVHTVRQAVQELSAAAFEQRAAILQSLPAAFIRSAKSGRFKKNMSDSTGRSLSWYATLAGVIYLCSLFKQRLKRENEVVQECVGVLIPPSVPAALVNVALLASGKVPVNLNFTTSREALFSSIKQCGIEHIIGVEPLRAKLENAPSGIKYWGVEEFFASPNKLFMGWCWLVAVFGPCFVLVRLYGGSKNPKQDLATILFSSGTTAEPKGIMLTHKNIFSNCTALGELFSFKFSDGALGILPFFHSFGLTATLWLPLVSGFRVVYHHNPLAATKIGELIEENSLTFLLCTPTFLSAITRKSSAQQLRTLVQVMVGAERLSDSVRQAFADKFGIFPLEGYGCTELSPVAIVNVPDAVDGAMQQKGNKPGTVGQPLPGVAIKIVSAEDGVEKRVGEEGELLVKGPNVMSGYLGRADLTATVLQNGWYHTGDIAVMDREGYITIVDRLSRFSKIGGEMVPHGAIEEAIQEIFAADEKIAVVTAVSDETRGEELVVLCTREADVQKLIKDMRERGLPNLWIPDARRFYRIGEFPYLASGKLDLRAVKELARNIAS